MTSSELLDNLSFLASIQLVEQLRRLSLLDKPETTRAIQELRKQFRPTIQFPAEKR